MSSYLKSLAKRRKKESPLELLYEVSEAFDESDPTSPARTLPRARELHDLIRFVMSEEIEPLLRDERDVLIHALAFARKIKDEKVEKLLATALDGKPQPPAVFTLALLGKEHQAHDVNAGDAIEFDGIDWGGTDVALSFAMDEFEAAVLDELIKAADEFDLQPPGSVRGINDADLTITEQ